MGTERTHQATFPVALFLVAAGTFLTALLGITLTRTADGIASLWLANAVLIAALVWQPGRRGPWLVAVSAVASALADVVTGDPLLAGLALGSTNAFEALVAALIIRKTCDRPLTFETLRQTLCFAAGAGLAAPSISASVQLALTVHAFGAPPGDLWLVWFLGHGLGNLTLAPVLILLSQRWARARLRSLPDLRTVMVTTWPIVLTAATTFAVFNQTVVQVAFLVLAAALLATFRLGPTGAALSAALIALIGGVGTAQGSGPMALGAGDVTAHILVFQLFVAVVLSCSLPVAALRAEREALAAKLQAAASTDSLTGLLNRRAVYERLDQLANKQASEDANPNQIGLLLVDLDRFKAVNDVHGHLVGDQLLSAAAERLMRCLQGKGTAYRLGGDEFALVCDLAAGGQGLPQEVAGAIVRAMAEPFRMSGLVHHIGASVGIAVFPWDARDRQMLLRRADMALYRAKQEGRGRFSSFESAMDAEIIQRARIEAELRAAVHADELRPFYQPIVSLASGRTLGFEMLARWPRDDGQNIGPDTFIPIAEEAGFIDDLTFQLLARACQDVRDWKPELTLAINIAPVQLRDPGLVERVLATLAQAGLLPSRLWVEITESALIKDIDLARRTVEAFHHYGVRIALDDFGTGYSSLHHLRLLPFDKIKIDQSFVQNMEASPEAAKIVRAIISLATSLELPVTAEGIENQSVAAELLALGCAQGQGYHYGRPVPAETVSASFGSLTASREDRADVGLNSDTVTTSPSFALLAADGIV